MQVKCPCGKLLKVPDTAAGKRVKCPACGKVFQVPDGPSAPPSTPAASDKIIVECSCGKKLAVPANAAGKQVRCPACKAVIPVPGGEEATDDSAGFSLLSDSEESDGEEYGVATSKCPACGAILDPGAQFCVSCGTHISTGTRVDGIDINEIERKKSDTKKARYAILVIIIVAALIIAGSVIALLPEIMSRLGKSSEPSEAPAPSDAEGPAVSDDAANSAN